MSHHAYLLRFIGKKQGKPCRPSYTLFTEKVPAPRHETQWVLWKCWCMSMYWSMLSSTALVCIVDLTSIVVLVCVCWNVRYAEELLP